MLFIVVCNIVSLAMQNPLLDQTSQLVSVLNALDLVFLSLFSAEAVIRTIALGFVLHPYSYLRDPWNALDFIILVLGCVLQRLFPGLVQLWS